MQQKNSRIYFWRRTSAQPARMAGSSLMLHFHFVQDLRCGRGGNRGPVSAKSASEFLFDRLDYHFLDGYSYFGPFLECEKACAATAIAGT